MKEVNPSLNITSSDIIEDENPNSILKNIKKRNLGRLIIGHLNINSIRNKLEPLKSIIEGNMDILILSETKINDSFPTGQFLIDGFATPFRLDRNSVGGGILIYIRKDIPCK